MSPRLSIRLLITAALVVPTLVLSIGLMLLGDSSMRVLSNALASEAVASDRSVLMASIEAYFGDAEQISDLYARLVRTGELDPAELPRWRGSTLQHVVAFEQVESISFGRPDGATFWTARVDGGFEYVIQDPGEALREYAIDPASPSSIELVQEYPFDVLGRPWYQTGTSDRSGAWSEVYVWAGKAGADSQIGMAYARTLTDRADTMRGVLGVDITLAAVSERLRSLSRLRDRYILLVDDTASLVASSEGPVTTGDGEQLTIEAAADRDGAVFNPNLVGNQTGTLRGEPARFSIRPFSPAEGLDWQLVVGIPESVFLSEAQATRRRLVALSSAGTLVMLVIALVIAASIVRRFHQLRDHARSLRSGRVEMRLPEAGLPEWRELAFAMNGIAEQLGDASAIDRLDRTTEREATDDPGTTRSMPHDDRGTLEHQQVSHAASMPTVLCVKLHPTASPRRVSSIDLDAALLDLDRAAEEAGLRPVGAAGSIFTAIAEAGATVAPNTALAAARLALQLLERSNERAHAAHKWNLAIALATGPVHARAVNAAAADHVIGEAIDTARTLCDHGPANLIQVHDSTRALIDRAFSLRERGSFITAHGGVERVFTLGGRLN